jgi:hypothetical protein
MRFCFLERSVHCAKNLLIAVVTESFDHYQSASRAELGTGFEVSSWDDDIGFEWTAHSYA